MKKKLKPYKGFWVVVNKQNIPLLWTVNGTKKSAISEVFESNNQSDIAEMWVDYEKNGFYVVKVNINFDII